MRVFAVFLLFVFSVCNQSYAATGCPGNDYLKLVNGRFDLCLPLQFFKNAIIGPTGGLLIKLPSGAFFGVEIVTPDKDSLPDTFDMRVYAEQSIGLIPPTGLTDEQTEIVKNSVAVLNMQFGAAKPVKYQSSNKTFYSIFNAKKNTTYVALDGVKDQVLLLNFHNMDEQSVQLILGGIQ